MLLNPKIPKQKENYLHRVGRTARAGRAGLVVNLVTERDLNLIADIEGKGQSPKELQSRFKDNAGNRLHLPEELRKPRPEKAKPVVKTSKPKGTPPPKFKPKPKPSDATMLKIHGKVKR